MSKVCLFAFVFLGFSASTLLTGCSAVGPASLSSPAAPAIRGVVHGGQPPVTGASIQLYAVGNSGDASLANALLTPAVSTDASGNFNITTKFTCPTPSTYVYLVATGGNPGLTAGTNNTAITMMAALGQCSTLNSSTFIFIDEATTVGSIAALYPYMTSASHLGYSSSDAAAFATAFNLVSTYTNIPAGTVQGPAQTAIDSLGNIIASCINSASVSSSPCSSLFSLSTPPAGVAPTDTITAILNILNNPTLNTTALFNLSLAVAPLQPALTGAPSNWYLPIVPTYNVSGQVQSSTGCGSNGLPGITVSINTHPVQTTTTDGNGNYSFSNVPNGTYTVTPSIIGPAAVFYPATQNEVVNSGNITAPFSAALGYTISGTAAYSGSQPGQIYLVLNNSNSCGSGSLGTSISAAGPFIIHGVPPGAYTLQAYKDNLGKGVQNAANPAGTTGTLTLSTANLSSVTVTLGDPAPVTLATAPNLSSVGAFSNGIIAQFKAITNTSQVETPASYTLQWSTTSSFASIVGSQLFPAAGTKNNVWFTNATKNPTLTNGNAYYFRLYGTSAGTAISPYSGTIGPITIAASAGANTVSGSVSFPGSATGPLYVGFFDNSNNFYGQYVANPVSAQSYSVQVPSGNNYFFVGILDQNNDGAIDVGDISDTGGQNDKVPTVISANPTTLNLALPTVNAIANVTTQNYQSTSSGGSSQNYNLNFQVNAQNKLPVAVSLASGPNVINPIDIGACSGSNGSGCGRGFQIYFSLGSTIPLVNDTYTFNVTYSDGTTGSVTAAVTAVLTSFATSLAPTGIGGSTTPTFGWTDPSSASSYTYSFNLNDSIGNTIWQIPGQNSNFSSIPSTITSIPWTTNTDVLGENNPPNPSTGLFTTTTYTWQIQVQDSNGNSAVTQVQYQP